MSPKRFSQHIANLCPVPARAVLVVLGLFVGLAAFAGLLLLLSPVSAPVIAAPAVPDLSLDRSGPLQVMMPLTATTTTITRTSGDSPSTFGDPLTFSATVTRDDTDNPVGAAGTVTFTDNDVNIPGCVGMSLDGLGSASCSTSSLSVGEHVIKAHYSGYGDFDPSTSGGLGQSVNKTTVTVTISVDDDTPVYGQELEFQADIEPSACSGVVFFDDGGTEIGRATLENGRATVETFRLGAGPHRVKAVYLGSDNCYEGESDVLELDVAKADTETTVTSSDNPSEYGQYVTFTATVSPTVLPPTRPGATTPTGLVTFIVDTMPIGQGTLDGSGEATFSTAELAATESTCWIPWDIFCNWPTWPGHSPHSVTAQYESDANYNTSAGDLYYDLSHSGQYVNRAATNVVMTEHDPSPSKYGESVTFTAEVKRTNAGIGTPTGKVVFKGWAGDDFEASLFVGSNEVTFMTMEPLDADPNPYTIEAEYHGDDNFQFSEVSVNHTVDKAPTTTELQDPLPETDYGQDAQFTISVKRDENYPGSGTPTGTVTLTITPGPPSSIAKDLPDTGSVVTIVTNTIEPDPHHDITAEYGGDSNFEGSTSDTVTHTVNKADSETTLESSANPSAFGQSVTFTATVEAAGLGLFAPITPTGTVTFTFGTAGTMTDTLDTSGVATIMTDTLPAGTHEITAEYSGDSSFKPSDDSLRQTVNTIATTTELSGPSSSAIGDSVTFTATVSETLSGALVSDGDVTFYDGVRVFATRSLVAGVATVVTDTLSAGLHPLKAVYNGTANFQPSTSQRLYHTVGAVGSTTVLTSSPASPTVFGQTVTFTATVTGSGGPPTGQVTFKDGAATIGTKTLVGGIATLTKSDLSVGTHPIKAVYGGDAKFASSPSNTVNHQVDKADTTTMITLDDPDPSVFGQPVVVNFTVTANSGSGTPTGNVTVGDGTDSCTGSVASAGSCTLMFSTPGLRTLTATYAGDANFNSSSSSGEDHDVDPADTTTTVTTFPNPSVTDQEVTITANVASEPDSTATPTGGTVNFESSGTPIGSKPLVNGTASITHTFTSDGSFTITATYLGDGTNFNPSPPGTTTHYVNVTPPDLSVTKTDSPDPVNVGDDLTYVINVINNETDPVNVMLTDTLPPQVSFDSAPGCTHDGSALGGVVTCDLGSLAGGGSASVTIIVKVPLTTPAGTVLRNTAQAGVHSDTEETTVYRSPRLGDCNGDDTVSLADVWAIVRHIFDPTYVGTSGCDANKDSRVDAGDVPSTVLIMFKEANHERQTLSWSKGSNLALSRSVPGRGMTTATREDSPAPLLLCSSAPLPGPALAMPAQVSAPPGGFTTVPVSFSANGHSITSLAFSVDYDETWLALDPADHDGNGIPDAVIFSLPGDFTASVTFDESDADGEVDIFIGDIAPPLTSLSDGPIAFMILNVASSPGATRGAVRFSLDPAASFGDTSGQSVPGTATPTGRYPHQIYLPMVVR